MKAKSWKERRKGNDSPASPGGGTRLRLISVFSVSFCSSFSLCFIVELHKFLLDPLVAVSGPQWTFCHVETDKELIHMRSYKICMCALFCCVFISLSIWFLFFFLHIVELLSALRSGVVQELLRCWMKVSRVMSAVPWAESTEGQKWAGRRLSPSALPSWGPTYSTASWPWATSTRKI